MRHEERLQQAIERLSFVVDSLGMALRSLVRQEGDAEQLDRIERKLDRLTRMEGRQMAFAQEVLDKIARQTTLIGSIKTWIQNLPTDVATPEQKAAILANLDANEAELSTAIPANTPLQP